MKNTKIQWCHSTVNPVMGCDGCELWSSPAKIITEMATPLEATRPYAPSSQKVKHVVTKIVGGWKTSEMYANRKDIIIDSAFELGIHDDKEAPLILEDVIRSNCKCYAGMLGTFRTGHKGYADQFEKPKTFPGRMETAARWGAPTQAEQSTKPWLLNSPRMIFVSDMGDALSRDISFEYLKSEIIDVVTSGNGGRHLWLWLTKRPARMAEFGQWLADQGITWPDNLVAMTTVTSQATAGRVRELRKVPSRFKGLSCEPIFGELNLDLTGIDWCIAGGGSDVLAEPFHVEWALKLRDQCRESGTAFFLKQLGKNPVFNGQPVDLEDRHGGHWDEWPVADWRTREIPIGFKLTS